MKMLVTGATGFIGRALVAESLRRGHSVTAVSRTPARARRTLGDIPVHEWEPLSGPLPAAALEGVEAVVHLAGENVADGRWTRRRKAEIHDSRVVSTRNLVSAFAEKKPRVFACASAVGYYGDRGDEILTEESGSGDDFLAEVCRGWEAEASKSRELGVRWVSMRTGIVLGHGGVLEKLLPPFRHNMGGPIGSGRHWISWIHLEDIVGLYLHALEREEIAGPVLGTAPSPATNLEFSRTLARVLGKWSFVHVPVLALRLRFGELAEVLVSSQRCDPVVAKRSGYSFRYPDLESALRQILS
ncbi:MAG: TIGR01777 family protein [Planctomycetes bacterium]|nr:TIGR01777 family protein [Planctomycetota bacterium]